MAEFTSFPHLLIERAARRTPQATAVRAGDREVTYRQLLAAAQWVCDELHSSGIKPGERVLVCADRTPDAVAALLGTLMAGCVCVPTDPAEPENRLRQMVHSAAPKAAVIAAADPPALARLLPGAPTITLGPASWAETGAPGAPGAGGSALTGPDDPAFVFFTSGSTGRPQAVVHSHRSAGVTMVGDDIPGPDDRVLGLAPMGSLRTIPELYLPLVGGACLVLARSGGQRDVGYLGRLVRDERVTVLCVTPSLLRLLLDEPSFAAAPALRLVHCSAEQLTPELARRFTRAHSARLRNVYGQTECSAAALTWLHQDGERPGNTDGTPAAVPLGRPGPVAEVHLLDDEGRPVPDGTVGEIHLFGPSLALGYLDDPDRTALRFPSVLLDGAPRRLLRTGDLARRGTDGVYVSEGRRDDQINVNGFRVSPAEIERALEAHPAVREVAVVTARAEPGTRAGVLTAHLVVAPGCTAPDTAAVQEFLTATLPAHMHPRGIQVWEELPQLPGGKVDRQALALAAASGPQQPAADPGAGGGTALLVIRAVEQLLGLTGVRVQDNFHALGGSSLELMRLAMVLNREAGVAVDIASFAAAPTIEALVRAVDTAAGRGEPGR
jgi:amino acid adenylation domain-containing protein